MRAFKHTAAGLVLGLIGLTGAATQNAAATDFVPTGNPKRGRDVFLQKGCLSCHAVRGVGGNRGPDLAVFLSNNGIFAVAAGMWSHAPRMKRDAEAAKLQFPRLSAREVADLLAYLVYIGFAGEPGERSNGRNLFITKGCAKCHLFGGVSERAPPVEHLMHQASPISIAQAMWNHAAEMQVEMQELGIERPQLNGQEMADIIAFLSGPQGVRSAFADAPGDPGVGKVLFEAKWCAACHMPKPDGAAAVHDLTKSGWYDTATGLAASMWNHSSDMVEASKKLGVDVPCFQGTEMADVLAYLYLIRSTEMVGDSTRGRQVFVSKHCAKCHAEGGIGPDLLVGAAARSPAQLASAMWNHAPTMEERLSELGFEWPILSGTEVGDLLAYLTAIGTR